MTASNQALPQQICWPTLPLAVYREVAAHLRQVDGVSAELLPQTTKVFDYGLSQVGGLQLAWSEDLPGDSRARVSEILEYYRQRYGDWQPPESVEH